MITDYLFFDLRNLEVIRITSFSTEMKTRDEESEDW